MMPENRDPLKGSFLRCLMLTSLPPTRFAEAMENLCAPLNVDVEPNAFYMPHGVIDPTEAQLHQAPIFLTDSQRADVLKWWLAHPEKSPKTPHWDIACQAKIDGKPGLILVEAKAHAGECKIDGKTLSKSASKESIDNHKHIGAAIASVRAKLNEGTLGGWNIKQDSHYQLSNRFAWSWKLASMGIPVVLVYLGFTNATDMEYNNQVVFPDHQAWESRMIEYSKDIVPQQVWNRQEPLRINDTPMWALIRSMEMGFMIRGG